MKRKPKPTPTAIVPPVGLITQTHPNGCNHGDTAAYLAMSAVRDTILTSAGVPVRVVRGRSAVGSLVVGEIGYGTWRRKNDAKGA